MKPPITLCSHVLVLSTVVPAILGMLLLAVDGGANPASPLKDESGSGQILVVREGQGKPVELPLKHTRVDARISGIVSTVKVTQEFGNPWKTPIEAVYVFPLPHNAAVYSMTMFIGQRKIEGEIKPREEARAIYDQARQQGKTASLLDQERPNIFTQSVANILPGDDIRVEISYFQDLAFDQGRYEFVFPMVVGPRYIPGGTTGKTGTGWAEDTDRVPDASRISPPLLPPGVRSGHDIEVRVDLDAGMPYRDMETPSHAIRVERKDKARAIITLSPEDTIPNKDFILRWRVDQGGPVAGWVAEKGKGDGAFLLVLEPEINLPITRTAPREYVFVIDTSGSMNGFPLDQCKRVLKKCLSDLRAEDRFQVILFAGSASKLSPSPLDATQKNIRDAIRFMDGAQGSGGTEFLPALEDALKAPVDPDRSRIVLFLSDGYIGYEAQVLKYMYQNRGDANVFPLGVGSSVNRFLIDAMARIGQGEPFYLTPDEDPDPVVEKFFRTVSRPSLTNIRVRFQGIDVTNLMPGALPDLFAGRPLSIVGRYRHGGKGKAVITGLLLGEPWEQTASVELPDGGSGDGGLARLWARRNIEFVSDQQAIGEISEDEARKRITALALEYSLMSAYTSFVAVDNQVRNPDGTFSTVAVPVPLPDQVSPLAAPAQAYQQNSQSRHSSPQAMGISGMALKKERKDACLAAPIAESPVPADKGVDERTVAAGPEPEKPDTASLGSPIVSLQIRGTLSQADARKIIEEWTGKQIQAKCLQGFHGSVTMSLEVLPDGTVKNVRIRDVVNLHENEKLLECLRKEAGELRFPISETTSYLYLKLAFP